METTKAVSLYIVEDDPHFRETFIDVMGLRGVEASGSGSAVEALTELRTHSATLEDVFVTLTGRRLRDE